jgi:MtN3 and saliva related transmembrane protein
VPTILAATAASWGVVMALSPILQIRSMRIHRSSHAVSIGYLCVLLTGFVLWLAYGVSIRNLPLVVANAISIIVSCATIGVALHYRATSQGGPNRTGQTGESDR